MHRPRRSATQRFDFSATRHPSRPSTPARAPASSSAAQPNAVPDIYRDMLAEARREEAARPQKRPAKRQRVEPPAEPPAELGEQAARSGGPSGHSGRVVPEKKTARAVPVINHLPAPPPPPPMSTVNVDSDDDIEFEDVDLPRPAIQTILRDSDDESSDSEGSDSDDSDSDSGDGQVIDFSQLDFENLAQANAAPSQQQQQQQQVLAINLSATDAAPGRARPHARPKRRPLTKEQKQQRIEVHQMHLLCLVWHCALRNHWCNDEKVHRTLKRQLTVRMRDLLCPRKKMLPFAQTESIKRGLEMAGTMWRIKFRVTEKGMRRALWAASPEELAAHQVPDDLEMCPKKEDFLEAATTMTGSRDVGAQLYCAFLRAAGIRCRLVCSLQVLPFTASGPSMAAAKPQLTKAQLRKRDMDEKKRRAMDLYKQQQQQPPTTTPMAGLAHRRRVGASAAAAASSSRSPAPQPAAATDDAPVQRESPYPVFWVEVLDKGSQKWNPADPLATKTFFRAKALEPPLSDKDNQLVYVLAFDDNGTVRDVTHRYTKAFKAKTRKQRIDHAVLPAAAGSGSDWWHRVLAHYTRRKPPSALRLAEDAELAASLAREPMPKRIGDFRGHPDYVLARHVKRHEVLVPGARVRGTIKPTGAAALERVYGRADVRAVYTREKWFRLGRQVRPSEHPAKILYRRRGRGANQDESEGDAAVAVYTEDQTDAFQHPPVVDGRVPRNKFGNLEIYTASMVPAGGAYIAHKKAPRAAHLLGIDYAPAVSGFEFRGRHGTAVMHGAVVAAAHAEAMAAVLTGLDDLYMDALEEQKRRVVLKAWRRFMRGLRIRAEVRARMGLDRKDGEERPERLAKWLRAKPDAEGQCKEPAEGEGEGDGGGEGEEEEEESELSELSDGEFIIEDGDDDDAGGGFIVEDDDGDDKMAGGFIIE